MSRRFGSSKPTLTPLTAWLWSQEHAKKAVEGNADPTTRQKPPIKNLSRTAGVAEGGSKGSRTCRKPPAWRGGHERLYGELTTEKILWQGEPSSIWRGTQALTQGRNHVKTSRRPSAWRGFRRRNDKYPVWKVAALTAPRGGKVFRRKKHSRTNTTHKKHTR